MSPPKIIDLAPLQSSISILPEQIATRPTTLVLTETASGYDFSITDRATGQQVFIVKGKTDSQHITKEVFDTKGRPVFVLKKKNSSNPKHYWLEAPDGTPFTEVEWSWGASAHFTSRFTNASSGQPVEMRMNASYFSRNGVWKIGDEVVAHVFRDAWTAKDMWKSKRTYHLSVAPGMDMAVALAACLYVHERVTEGCNGSAKGKGVGESMTLCGAV